MKISIEVNDVITEYSIKSRQAIEILDIVEKSGLFDKAKSMSNLTFSPENIGELITLVPLSYKTAYNVLAICTGTVKDGKVVPNNDLIDNVDAIKLPIYAIQIVKTLLFPISYVISGDKVMEDEKKKDSVESVDINPGTNESSSVPVE